MTEPDELIDEPPRDRAAAESDDARGGRRIAAIDAMSGSLTESSWLVGRARTQGLDAVAAALGAPARWCPACGTYVERRDGEQ